MLHSGRKWIADQANGEDYFEINEVSTIFFFHGIVIIEYLLLLANAVAKVICSVASVCHSVCP